MNINGHIEPRREPQQLRIIKADQISLNAHWPWLRERLIDIKASNEYPRLGERRQVDRKALAVSLGQSGRCRWTPEQVRFAIMRGFHGNSQVELFYVVGSDFVGYDDEIKGFLVSVCNIDPIACVPLDFSLWLLWSGYPRLLEDATPLIDDLARERGCTAIEHSSPRQGWWRRQRNCGDWKLKLFTWRKELT